MGNCIVCRKPDAHGELFDAGKVCALCKDRIVRVARIMAEACCDAAIVEINRAVVRMQDVSNKGDVT